MTTVPASTRTTTYTLASASAGPFLVGFRIFDSTLRVTVNGAVRTDYTLSATFTGGYSDTASITFGASLATADVIVIDGAMPIARSAEYLNPDPNLTRNLNIEQGRQWAALQQTARDIGRLQASLAFIAGHEDNGSGVRAFGAMGDGATSDQVAFDAALAENAPDGPVFVPWSDAHYVLSTLSDADRSRLYGPGEVRVGGTKYEISRVPRVGRDRATMAIVDWDWRPLADFAAVDTDDGPFLMDVRRKGTTVGSFAWALFLGTMPDEKPAGVHDHILTIWANPARVTGPATRTNGLWAGVNTTASGIAGQGGTTGIDGLFTAAEFNFGNQKYDAGIRTTFGAAGDVAGLLLVPDTAPSPLGPNYWSVAGITIATPGVVTVTGHNFVNNMGIRLYANTGTLPTGIIDGGAYWIVNVSGDTFQLSSTPGGTGIATTGSFAAGVRCVPYYHAPHGLVFSRSVNNQQIGVPIEIETDTIQDGGHGIVAKGSSVTTPRPSNVLLVLGTWTRAIDATAATFTSGIFAILGDNHAVRWGASTGAGIRGTTGVLDLTPGGTSNGRLLANGFVAGPMLQWNSTGIAFYGTAPIAKPTVTGSRGGNAALASLLTELANLGLVTNSTTA